MQKTLVRITTVPISLRYLLRGQLAYMSHHFKVYAVSSPGPFLDEVKEEEGVEVFPIEMTRKITPFKDIRAVYKLYRFLKKIKPDIVHTHTPKAGLIGMLASRLAGVPVRLHTVAGLPLMERSGIEKKLLIWVERFTYLLANQVYPNSLGLKNYIIEKKISKKNKLKIIGKGSSNGINLEIFQLQENINESAKNIRETLKIRPNDIVFLFIGRLVKDKGVAELAKAFDNISWKYANSMLIFVGSTEDDLDPVSEDIKELLKSHPRIKMVGFQSEVRPYLALSDVFVLPSYREGFPNVVLQAGCFNLPCIVSDINGCNEIIEDGLNGILIKPKSVPELTAAMARLIENETERKQMASLAREMVAKRYDQQEVWRLLLSEYENLLKK